MNQAYLVRRDFGIAFYPWRFLKEGED